MDNANKHRYGYLRLALAVAFLLALWVQYARLIDPYSVEEDFRNFYWMHRFQNPDLFVDDPTIYGRVVSFVIGPIEFIMDNGSPLYSVLFQLTSGLIEPVLLSKLLIFPLLLTGAYYAFAIGDRLKGSGTGLALSLAFTSLILASHSAISVVGGLQRSFVTPLLLAMVYHLLVGQWHAAAIWLLFGGLIYPPTFLVGAGTYGLLCLGWDKSRRWPLIIHWRRLIPLLVVTFLVLLVLLPVTLSGLNNTATIANDAAADGTKPFILNDPLYQKGGRFAFFLLFPLVGRGGIVIDGTELVHILFLFGLIIWFWRMKPTLMTEIPPVLKAFFFAGVFCYLLSWVSILLTSSFVLYLPSRFTQATFFLFGLIVAIIHLPEGLNNAARWIMRLQGKLIWGIVPLLALSGLILVLPVSPDNPFLRTTGSRWLLLGLILVCIGLMVVIQRRRTRLPLATPVTQGTKTTPSPFVWPLVGGILFVASLFYVQLMGAGFYQATTDERALLAFLATLPEDSLLVGPPCLLDGVPLFARRQVLFTCERPHPDPDVVRLALETYYAPTLAGLAPFCLAHGVDYVVVNEADFTPARIASGSYFFEPYDSELRPVLQQQQTFALAKLDQTEKLFQQGDLVVIACR
ncbi:MAG: hypothetical protein KA314_12120 [Chloroflexi bacterium]|nr:hypothetical protein [Chloroflexota bacterium]MBP8056581.1 hypothetical protein [Chloroflexota bacterium]